MTNKEFAEEMNRLTKPKYSAKVVAAKLGVTPQRLTYWTRIKAVLDPDEECPFNLDKLEEK